jgi:hypothetical protein
MVTEVRSGNRVGKIEEAKSRTNLPNAQIAASSGVKEANPPVNPPKIREAQATPARPIKSKEVELRGEQVSAPAKTAGGAANFEPDSAQAIRLGIKGPLPFRVGGIAGRKLAEPTYTVAGVSSVPRTLKDYVKLADEYDPTPDLVGRAWDLFEKGNIV